MSSNAQPEAMTPARAASALGVSVETLRRWEDAGKLTARRTVGGHRRYSIAEINRLRSDEAGE